MVGFKFRTALRRIAASALVASVLVAPNVAAAQDDPEIITSHGYNFFGDLAYPADYPHLNYVNPDAPKGGEISVWFPGTFDSFNPYARQGRPGHLASSAFESLMYTPADDINAQYGLLAEKIEYPATKDWVIFHLRPQARFSDGSPVTAEDVVFTHNLFIEQGLPSYSQSVSKRILGVEALDQRRVKFTFAPDIPRRSLIATAGGTPVFSKAWYERTGARLDEGNLNIALGSGPYVLDSYDINARIIYRRNPDYWANDLPFAVGTNNFDTIRVEYFADSSAAFEGFKAGAYTFRQENSSRNWATGYDFPARDQGHVVTEDLPNGAIPAATGLVFNLAKPKFQDRRVREAIGLAYNFSWSNDTLQYGLFSQRESFWQNSENAAQGVPEGDELALLQSLGDLIDPAILTEPVTMPHTSGARQSDRRNMRRASQLLDDAGWVVSDDGGGMRMKDGETLTFELLEDTPNFDRMLLPFVENLRSMGIDATYNRVDPAQFTNRRRARDYDMIFSLYTMGDLPSTALFQQFGSESADVSVFNPAGYSNPAIDALIERVVAAKTTAEVRTAARAMDRIMRRDRFIIPVWYNDSYWVAYYDMFEYPDPLPTYALGHLDFWWYNAEKAQQLKAQGALR